MNVWLLQVGEPLPIDPPADRRLRMSLLAEALVARGHSVLWWSATFDHVRKRHRFPRTTRLKIHSGFELYLLHSPGYPRNVSLQRLRDHRALARAFTRRARAAPSPDVVIAGFPPVGLAAAGVRFAEGHSVPSVVDVRDLWPDAIAGLAPSWLSPLARAALLPMRRSAARTLAHATVRTAVSDSYLRWAAALGGVRRTQYDRAIPLGYPPLDVEPAARERAGQAVRAAGVDPTRRIVWFLGTFGRTYDLTTVIAAARQIASRGRDDIQFVLSGDGDRADEWRTAARDVPNVVFTGWVDTPAIAYLGTIALTGLAAYAPRAPQSLPNKLFEYLAAGLPVISSLAGEAADLLRQQACGLSYPAGDAGALAAAVLRLADDARERARMADAARRAFDDRYDARRLSAAYVELIEAVHAGSA